MIDENYVNDLYNILADILNPNNDIRNKAETKINILQNSDNRKKFIIGLSNIINMSKINGVKNISCILLNKYLSVINSISVSESNWKLLGEHKEDFKSKIINAYINESDLFIKKKICDIITNIAECCFEAEEKWEDLSKLIIDGLNLEINQQNINTIESQVYLITKLFAIISDTLENHLISILSSFNKYFSTNYICLRTVTAEAIVEMMHVLENKNKKKLKSYFFEILKVTYDSLNYSTNNSCALPTYNQIKECNNNLSISKAEECLRRNILTISEINNVMPSLLKSYFSDLFILMGKISENTLITEHVTREMSFDVITSLIDTKPELFIKDQERFKIFIQSLYKYSFEIEDYVDEEWTTPKSNSYIDEDFIPEEKLEAVLIQIDRLINYLEFDFVMVELNAVILELINKESKHWKYKYIGYMTISQIIEHVKDLKTLENIIDLILNDLVNNNHPKIRYSCLQCVEQLSQYLNPSFQNKYHNVIISNLITIISKDNVLRNRLQACESLQSFLEHCTSEKILRDNNYIKEILENVICIFVKDNIEISLRESILNVISELTEVADEFINPYAEECLKLMLNFFSKIYNNNEFKSLYGSLIEVITILGSRCKESYIKFIPDLVKALLSIQDEIPKSTDPLFENLKSAWKELLPFIKTSYPELLESVFNSIFKLIENTPKVFTNMSNNNASNGINDKNDLIDITDLLKKAESKNDIMIKKEKVKNITTSETSDYAGAIELLNTLIESSGNLSIPYLKKAENLIIPLLSFENNSDIRQESSNTLLEIVTVLSSSMNGNTFNNNTNNNNLNKENLTSLVKYYIVALFQAIEKEHINSTISIMLDNTGSIIENIGFKLFNNDELIEITNKLLAIFEKIEKFRLNVIEKKNIAEKEIEEENKNNELLKDNDDNKSEFEYEEDDFADQLENEIKDIEDVLVSIADIFGNLFKTHKELSLNIVYKLKDELLIKYLKPESSLFEKKMAVFILDDIVEFIGHSLVPDMWNDITNILMNYIDHKDHALRQASSYGLGEIAANTIYNDNNNLFKERYNDLFYSAFQNSINSNPKDNINLKEWGNAMDNITVAIGKVIKFQLNNIDQDKWVKFYINCLPITYEEDEAQDHHLEFMSLINYNSQVMLGNNNCNLPKILLICSEIYQTKLSTDKLDEEILKIFNNIKSNINQYTSVINSSKELSKSKIITNKLNDLLKIN